jgi:hypothetical protein
LQRKENRNERRFLNLKKLAHQLGVFTIYDVADETYGFKGFFVAVLFLLQNSGYWVPV